MNKLKSNKLTNIISCFVVITLLFIFMGINPKATNISYAENEISIDSSKFIYSPIFCTRFDNQIYFIDNHDDCFYLKTFETNTDEFSYAKSIIQLDFNVVDAYSENNLFFMLTNNQIFVYDLTGNASTPKQLENLNLENNQFSSIFVYQYQNEYVITLTPTDFISTNPMIIIYNHQSESFSIKNINDENLKDSHKFTKLSTIKVGEQNYFYLYFGAEKLYYNTLSLESETINIGKGNINFIDQNLCTDSEKITSVNIINSNQDEYFLITRQTDENYISKLYTFDFTEYNNPTFEEYTSLFNEISTEKVVLTSENYLIFSKTNQTPQIVYIQIDNIDNNQILENPQPEIDEFNENNYLTKFTIQSTHLLSNPWNTSSNIEIPANTDILVIGTAKIDNQKINNIYYCLYTSKNQDGTFSDNFGYIRAQHLEDKAEIELSELNLAKTVKVLPDTVLYSLPSKASEQKMQTNGKFAVTIETFENSTKIKLYKTDSIQWIKVKINNESGYIDISKINYSAGKINYITTNATIINDNTYVYTDPSENSSLIRNKPLYKGKTVFIVGKRDTQTGFTKIKFNDEFGNEFEGYIKTENIKSDAWSQLQIIGSILIAINTGILILILVFKNKKLNKQKYQNEINN